MLILSLYPGIDLLGRAFEERGACVVSGPELFLGRDIANFKAESGKFDGVIGGPPCQQFSGLNRNPDKQKGMEGLKQFERVVKEASPIWWLMENVAAVPDLKIEGFNWQRFNLCLSSFDDYSRLRAFQFGSRKNIVLDPMHSKRREVSGGAVTGSDKRSYAEICRIQGLDQALELPHFHNQGKKQVVANAVPLQMGRYVAGLICDVPGKQKCDATPFDSVTELQERSVTLSTKRCACGCGRTIYGRAKTASAACRKRVSRKKDYEKLTIYNL